MKFFTGLNLFFIVLYVALMSAGYGGLRYARGWSLRQLTTPQAREDWDQWRDEAQRQHEGQGPVTRHPVRSVAPPMLVLLNDYFGVCVTAMITIGSVLFFSFAWMLQGALRTVGPITDLPNLEEQEANIQDPIS